MPLDSLKVTHVSPGRKPSNKEAWGWWWRQEESRRDQSSGVMAQRMQKKDERRWLFLPLRTKMYTESSQRKKTKPTRDSPRTCKLVADTRAGPMPRLELGNWGAAHTWGLDRCTCPPPVGLGAPGRGPWGHRGTCSLHGVLLSGQVEARGPFSIPSPQKETVPGRTPLHYSRAF